MRRTVVSALIVVSGMVGVGTGAVAAFDAFSDPHRPARVQHSTESATAGIRAPEVAAPNAGDPASVPPPAPAPEGSVSDVPAANAPTPETPEDAGDAVDPATGVLSDAFAELGLDDPTTPDVDEGAPDPCTALVSATRAVGCVLR